MQTLWAFKYAPETLLVLFLENKNSKLVVKSRGIISFADYLANISLYLSYTVLDWLIDNNVFTLLYEEHQRLQKEREGLLG